ncbi:hypothetical protein GCM10011403_24100 [Pseudohongiella nitratireducens]|uniref:CcoQ/FixQ family Cbb3-type cytochrome c oxidase assembly chaperone n=1 Tax=Pseudohongiella nitratireducens TaxID=1768907 RepID=A0A916QKK9_9GAMM|nr:hypothetical protein [Pseudohongiella nitratireducens]MDF1623933.1 hypothetical protein [Pseudohongiella nitratireducens]GFZ80120.1 hypothetical protein GCM10011403_24100 [Pseudohongiella nitratireducens]|tara:strand:- start:6708 stop:6851 length:144 start_codon:yes stop_codon:yes gene_type:complete
MTYFIFAGDMLVMLFMVVLVIWLTAFGSKEDAHETACIPLKDDIDHG